MYYTKFISEISEIILAGDETGLKHLHLNSVHGKRKLVINTGWQRNDLFFKDIVKQLNEYFSGSRKSFDVKLSPDGTDFQKKIWQQLLKIPYGETSSYGEIAAAIGQPKASRAVGATNGRNPVSLIVPCHRVIGSNGKLTGYAHGLELKQWLLEHESKNMQNKTG